MALQRFITTDDAESLHDLRVALRRLQSLLRIKTHHSTKQLRRLLKTTNRARDLEIFIQILHESHLSLAKQEMIWRQQLSNEMQQLQQTVPLSWQTITLTLPDTFEEGEELRYLAAKQLHHEIQRLRQRRKRLCHHWGDQAAHKLRISGKHIRYLLEPFTLPDTPIEQCIDELKSFQNQLGEYHDYATLLTTLKSGNKMNSAANMLVQNMEELRDRFVTCHCRASDNLLDIYLDQAERNLAPA